MALETWRRGASRTIPAPGSPRPPATGRSTGSGEPRSWRQDGELGRQARRTLDRPDEADDEDDVTIRTTGCG